MYRSFLDFYYEVRDEILRTENEINLVFLFAPKDNRKEFALWVNKYYPELAYFLFLFFDNKSIMPALYKRITKEKKWDQ